MTNLLDEIAHDAGGVAVASGGFTLDRDKAKEKLRHFQLADPCAWLLEIVRAASVLGASFVDVATDADDVRVSFDGAPFTREDVDEIYAALLARSAPPARAHLAVALNAVMALEPRFVRMESVHGGEGVRLELRPGKPDAITALAPKAARPATTTLHVREPFRAGHFVSFFRALSGTKREIVALRRACRFAPFPVRVNGKQIQAQKPGISATAGGQAPGQLVLLHRGVVLEETAHPLAPLGALAVLEGTSLSRDASLQAFRRDAAYTALLDAALVALLKQAEGGHALSRGRAAQAFGEPVIALVRGTPSSALGPLDAWPRLTEALRVEDRPCRAAPLFVDVRGGAVTLNDLVHELRAHGDLLYARRDSQAATLPRRFIALRDEEESARFFAVVGDAAKDGETALRAAEVRAQQAAKLAARRARTLLPPDEYIATLPITGAYQGEIALRRFGSTQLVVSFFTDGCLVCTEALPSPLPGLSLAIGGRFTLNDAFDGVIRDRAFIDALALAWSHIPALLERVPASVAGDALERVRGIGAPFLLWAHNRFVLRRKLLRDLGAARPLACELPDDDALPALPEVHLNGERAHPLARVPLVRRADGALVTLDALCAQERIAVIPPDIKSFSVGHAILAGETLRGVLKTLRPLEILDDQALRETQRARIKALPAVARPPPGALPVEHEHDGLRCTLSLGDERGAHLVATIEGRPWCTVRLSARVGPLRLAVDAPDALPLKDGGLDAADLERFVRAALGGMPALLDRVVDDGRTQPRARELLWSMLEALFPHATLRAAASSLDTAAFLALLRFAEDVEPSVLTSLIELALEVGKPPSVATLRALHAELQLSSEPASEDERRALRFSVALFGGEHALIAADRGQVVRAALARLPALGRIAVRTLADRAATVNDVIETATKGPVGYVPVAFERAQDFEHLILDEPRRATLERLLGPGVLVDKSDEVRRALAQRAFAQRPREDGRLLGTNALLVHDFVDGAINGQMGLLAPTTTEPTASVRVLRDRRFVVQLDVSAHAACSFVAVIDDPELPLTSDLAGIASPGAQARLLSVLARAADDALDRLADEAHADREALHARAPRASWLFLERLAQLGRRPVDAARLRRWLALPVVEGARGGWLSVLALRSAAKEGRAAWVSNTRRALETDDGLVVAAVRESNARDLLRRAVGAPLKDAEAEWAKAAALSAHVASLRPLPSPPRDTPVRVEEIEGDARISLWLTLGPAVPVLHVGAEGRTVALVPVDVPLRGLTGAVDAPSWVIADWRAVEDKHVIRAADTHGVALARALCDAAAAGDAIAELEARDLVLALARRSDSLRDGWRALHEELEHVALFPVADGARISLADALVTRPRSLLPQLILAGLVSADAVVTEAETRPAPEPEDPTAGLRARLEETLALVKLEEHAAAELLRWPIAITARGADVPAVELVGGRTSINVDDPLVQHALDVSQDPAPFFVLCALVYAAINARLHEVTPEHERAFLARLLTHARSAR